MIKRLFFTCFFILCIFGKNIAQEIEFHLDKHFLASKTILKVKRNFKDPFLWVLAKNNEVFRINSQTNEVKDYTPLFANYNNLSFIDIAGENQDLFFVATNSNILLLFKNNTVKQISAQDGLIESITSIGIDFMGTFNNITGNLLMIGTTGNNYRYNIDTDQLIINDSYLPTDVYVATYSKIMSNGFKFPFYNTDLTYLPVLIRTPPTTYVQYLWKDVPPYGSNINTAYYTFGSVGQNYNEYNSTASMANYSNLFWGNENGMFQINRNLSHDASRPHKEYLSGITVNKINSIYGLSGFGPTANFDYGVVQENLLVGTEQGLYYGTNMYKKYDANTLLNFSLIKYTPLNDTKINDINVNCVSIKPHCEDGAWLATDNGLYFLRSDYAKLTSTITSNAAKFDSNPNLLEMEFCNGTEATAKVDIDVLGNNIQWYKNNSPITLSVNPELKITTAGSYYALIYNSCANIYLKTNTLVAKFADAPEISFDFPDHIDLCKGSAFYFYTTQKAGYNYRWFKDNIQIPNAIFSNYTTTVNGKYRVEVSGCSNIYYPSKEVTISIIDIPMPVIRSNKTAYCEGDIAELGVDQDINYKITWMKEGIHLPDFDGLSIINTKISGKYIATYEFNSSCSKQANAYILNFDKFPVFKIETNSSKILCEGKEAILKANISGVSYLWNTGETSQSIKINKSGTYSVEVKNLSGCASIEQIEIDVVKALKVSEIPNMVLCTIKGEEINLKADLGFKNYSWNGINSSSPLFKVSKPGKYELKVTDYNNCSTSTYFEVFPWCKELVIPNSFSPNDDGINDLWRIGGLENDKNIKITIFDRNGTKVYQSDGTFIAWDGKSNNKALPIATYFYLITSQNSITPLKGSITIFR